MRARTSWIATALCATALSSCLTNLNDKASHLESDSLIVGVRPGHEGSELLFLARNEHALDDGLYVVDLETGQMSACGEDAVSPSALASAVSIPTTERERLFLVDPETGRVGAASRYEVFAVDDENILIRVWDLASPREFLEVDLGPARRDHPVWRPVTIALDVVTFPAQVAFALVVTPILWIWFCVDPPWVHD